MANKQTIATAKYQAKVGILAKTYKIKKDTVERFALACKSNGESQSSAISRLMDEYSTKNEAED